MKLKHKILGDEEQKKTLFWYLRESGDGITLHCKEGTRDWVVLRITDNGLILRFESISKSSGLSLNANGQVQISGMSNC